MLSAVAAPMTDPLTPMVNWPDNFIDAWTKDIGVQYRTDGDTNGENLGMAWKPIDIDPVNVTRSSARKACKLV